MTFLEKLDWLMRRDRLNKHTLAQKSGIPYTTIVGLYERGAENARMSTVNRLCTFFNVPLDYLALDEYDKPEDFVPHDNMQTISVTDTEQILLSAYRQLNAETQRHVLTMVKGLAGNPSMQKEPSRTETA